MRLDSGNRSFLALLALGVVLLVALATAACAFLSLLLYGLATEGQRRGLGHPASRPLP